MVEQYLSVYLPEEMEPYRGDLEYFFNTMIRKLNANRHKGTSRHLDLNDQINKMRKEVDEVESALKNESQFDPPIEAADVANHAFLFAACVWHMTREQFEEQR